MTEDKKYNWDWLDWEYPAISIDPEAIVRNRAFSLGDVPRESLWELRFLAEFCKKKIHYIRTKQYAFARSVKWETKDFPPEYEKANQQVKELNYVRMKMERACFELDRRKR